MFGMKQYKKGMTLVEVMVVAVCILVSIIALLSVFTMSLNFIVKAKELTIATDDLKDVLEKIRCTPFQDLAMVFPDGSSVNASAIGGFLLEDEDIVINYTNGETSDPLEIEVIVTWTSKNGTIFSRTFKTLRTRML